MPLGGVVGVGGGGGGGGGNDFVIIKVLLESAEDIYIGINRKGKSVHKGVL